MTRPKKETYATESDLSWFRLENYSSLPGRRTSDFNTPELSAAVYSFWASIIRDRVGLMRFLDAGQTAYAAGQFERIKSAPLTPLGFDQKYSGGTHIANTSTVKAITVNRVHWLNEAMIRTKAGERDIVDVNLRTDPENTFGDYAHVMVSIHATDVQLVADFKNWLAGWRESTSKVTQGLYDAKIGRWIEAKALPGMDLKLFTRITGKQLESNSKLAKLCPGYPVQGFEALRRKHAENIEAAFTDDMAKIIGHLAES